MENPFKACTGLMGSTQHGQIVTAENAHFLPPGSVVRFYDLQHPSLDGVLIRLHDDVWYYRTNTPTWCYDRLERFIHVLPGTLCHIPPSQETD